MGEAKRNAEIRARKAEFRKQLPKKIFRGVVNILFMPVMMFIILPFMHGFKENEYVWNIWRNK